ncbi:MAG: hypothetical protein PHC51_02810 [bacterium]|nr:hypothetical protein [bacterium]
MTTAGWIFMLGSIGFVISLTAFCFYRFLLKPAVAEHMHAPIDIETGDKE